MKRWLVLVLALTALAMVWAIAGDDPGSAAAPAAAPAAARGSASRPLGYKLADQVLGTKDFGRSVRATRTILALSGIATVREGEVILPGIAPLSRWRMTARETVLLAKSASMQQVPLGQLVRRLAAAGVTIGGRPVSAVLPEMIATWISAARFQPRKQLSAPALFVEQMQARHASRVPLPLRTALPAKMVLSPLEAIVALANLERVIEPGAPPNEPEQPRAVVGASTGGPCASVQSALDQLGPIGSGAASLVIGKATSSAVEAYADSIADEGGEKIGLLLTALDISDRILRSVAFGEHVSVVVYPGLRGEMTREETEQNKVHRPWEGKKRDLHFVATVGLDDEGLAALKRELDFAKDEPFQESLRQCAKLHGVTIPRPYSDLPGEMVDWSPFWSFYSRDAALRPPQRTKFRRLDVTSVVTALRISIDDEPARYHDNHHTIIWRQAVAKVEIAAQKPPSFGAMKDFTVAIATGGTVGDFAGPIAELAEGLYRTLAKPVGWGSLTIERHTRFDCARSASVLAHSSC